MKVAIKEAIEESGIKQLKPIYENIFEISVSPVSQHVKRGKDVSSHLHFVTTFILEADENEYISSKADENSAVKWIDLDKVLYDVTEEHMKSIYLRIIEKTKQLR